MSAQAAREGGRQTQRGGVSPVAGPQGAFAGARPPILRQALQSGLSIRHDTQGFSGARPGPDPSAQIQSP
jgi:hypothetical protein